MGKIYKINQLASVGSNIKSGIYKINFPNNKCYIGLSNNIKKRFYSHCENDYKLKRLLGFALNKYGIPEEIEILEEISADNRALMSEREKYWISFYKSNDKKFGYNMTDGGEGLSSSGTSNGNAKLNQKQIEEIYNLIKNSDFSLQKIAKQYQVSRTTIGNINNGLSYYNKKLEYPLRSKEKCAKVWTGIKSSSAKLTETEINEIYQLIINSDLTFSEIGEKYKISNDTIGLINKGKRYHNNNLIYPLRNAEKIKQIQYKRK